ncbi:MAG: trehalase family glycosidase, partial [Bacteriovoracia bacterium]
PLLEGEYRDFWMNPATRYDAKTGLNHHWDAVNLPRPERFGADDEKRLGRTYRDVRAGAESGEDFTETHEGEATQIASVLLNSVLGKVEADLAWMAEQLGDDAKSAFYREARRKRIDAMNRYLWDPQTGFYYNYHLRERRPVAVVSGNTFAPLFAELASPEQAAALRSAGAALEGPGGIRASLAPRSPHQWDGSNGWAPYQYFAIQGLSQYGYVDDSRRIARKWVEALTRVFHNEGTMIERVDVDRVAAPIDDGSKYAPQPDFLWSIATFEWCVIKILRTPTRKAAH